MDIREKRRRKLDGQWDSYYAEQRYEWKLGGREVGSVAPMINDAGSVTLSRNTTKANNITIIEAKVLALGIWIGNQRYHRSMMTLARADRHLGEKALHTLGMNDVRKPSLRCSGKVVGYFS